MRNRREKLDNLRRQFPRPSNFIPAGEVTEARIVAPPSFVHGKRRNKGKRRAGEIYEQKAQTYLCEKSDFYVPGPWIAFRSRKITRLRWCQPDGLILDFTTGLCTIVEIKLKHTSLAWWQVRELYEPVVRFLLRRSSFEFAALEVAKYVDSATPFPEQFGYIRDFSKLTPGKFGLHHYSTR